AELLKRRRENLLTVAAYDAVGGISGALVHRAEAIYNRLQPSQQEAARQLFLRLIKPSEDLRDAPRRIHRIELKHVVGDERALDAVIDEFGRHRLLTFDHDPITREPTVEIAHEALIEAWTQLRLWLDESREHVLTQQRLARWASEWEKHQRNDALLATEGWL